MDFRTISSLDYKSDAVYAKLVFPVNYEWIEVVFSSNFVEQQLIIDIRQNCRQLILMPAAIFSVTCEVNAKEFRCDLIFDYCVAENSVLLDAPARVVHQGSPNVFVRGPHKLLHKSSKTGRVT